MLQAAPEKEAAFLFIPRHCCKRHEAMRHLNNLYNVLIFKQMLTNKLPHINVYKIVYRLFL